MILEKTYSDQVSQVHRKKFAQFFTPEPVAQLMVDWILGTNNLNNLLEPAFGLGVFSRLLLKQKKDIQIYGFDVDPVIFNSAKQNFYNYTNVKLFLEDYIFNDWENKYDGIICNPPYFKFQHYENKKTLEEIKKRLHINLSGLTNMYSLFLLKSMYQLNQNGRVAYIVPSEFLNSDYGKYVKEFLLNSNTLRHIIIFDFKEKVFDNALTTSTILLLAKDTDDKNIHFSTITDTKQLKNISKMINEYPQSIGDNFYNTTEMKPDKKWRVYYQQQQSHKYHDLIPFRNVAKVVRGIATGSNDYFTFNTEKVKEFSIRDDFLLPCITKSKDVLNPFFTNEDFDNLKTRNSKIFLFNAGKEPKDKKVFNYIVLGEQEEIDKKYLTSKRNPWFILESRPPSPIWVGVFNRNGLKFVRNEAGINNLTTFHCVYPMNNLFNKIDIDLLFAYLLTDTANQIFNDNRREYGDGLKKFEPNDLNNALMLDLSKLEKTTENKILECYSKYRNSVIGGLENKKHLAKIDKMLKSVYRINKTHNPQPT